jgi:hypothetical protein
MTVFTHWTTASEDRGPCDREIVERSLQLYCHCALPGPSSMVVFLGGGGGQQSSSRLEYMGRDTGEGGVLW